MRSNVPDYNGRKHYWVFPKKFAGGLEDTFVSALYSRMANTIETELDLGVEVSQGEASLLLRSL